MATVNGFDKTAFFMGTVGAEHPAELVRTAVSSFTGGAAGVVRPDDLRVSATDIPSGKVRIGPGAVVIPNTIAGVQSESYVGRAPVESLLDIPENVTANARIDLIGVRIKDPEYGDFPSPPSEEAARDWEYIDPFLFPNASPAQLAAVQEGDSITDFPVYWLASLNLPDSTGTVENDMLASLRDLVQPHFVSDVKIAGPTPEAPMNNEGGAVWPDYRPDIKVPVWATRASVIATLSSIGHRDGPAMGYLTAVLGAHRASNILYDLELNPSAGQRHTLVVGGDWPDIRDIAGKTVKLQLEARKLNASTNPGYLVTVDGTQVIFDIHFYEDIVD